jgi:hypothetical protein
MATPPHIAVKWEHCVEFLGDWNYPQRRGTRPHAGRRGRTKGELSKAIVGIESGQGPRLRRRWPRRRLGPCSRRRRACGRGFRGHRRPLGTGPRQGKGQRDATGAQPHRENDPQAEPYDAGPPHAESSRGVMDPAAASDAPCSQSLPPHSSSPATARGLQVPTPWGMALGSEPLRVSHGPRCSLWPPDVNSRDARYSDGSMKAEPPLQAFQRPFRRNTHARLEGITIGVYGRRWLEEMVIVWQRDRHDGPAQPRVNGSVAPRLMVIETAHHLRRVGSNRSRSTSRPGPVTKSPPGDRKAITEALKSGKVQIKKRT